ncbi:unnamed protein product [Ranitomeya imitator]|uniref:Gap junction protein n=1 Tax=Ranitomeya imitator TaxID=111125 RepID=A0ABN9LE93_9NEOB|nr:unnamed protein product [Ranitomeya imitator]
MLISHPVITYRVVRPVFSLGATIFQKGGRHDRIAPPPKSGRLADYDTVLTPATFEIKVTTTIGKLCATKKTSNLTMAGWDLLKILLDEVQEHSTLIGKVWLTVLFIFRILILSLAGESVWGDEQSDFTCNTIQPGCINVCYDKAFPISHVRYWVLQFLFVSTPTLIYLGHVIYLSRREEKLMQGNAEVRSAATAESKTENNNTNTQTSTKKIKIHGPLVYTYAVSVIFKSVFEAGFVFGQWYLYGFVMPPSFECSRVPCPHKVNCYVSRPMEKTIFIIFMLVVSVISFLLNLLELIHLFSKQFQKRDLRMEVSCYSVHKSTKSLPNGGSSHQSYTNPTPSDQELPVYSKVLVGITGQAFIWKKRLTLLRKQRHCLMAGPKVVYP